MGAYNELGHYAFNGKNDWEFTSLRQRILGEDIGDVWSILPFKQQVVFRPIRVWPFLLSATL